jgi:hypothetical protein
LFNSKIKNKFSSDSVKQDSENKKEEPKKEENPQSKKVEHLLWMMKKMIYLSKN